MFAILLLTVRVRLARVRMFATLLSLTVSVRLARVRMYKCDNLRSCGRREYFLCSFLRIDALFSRIYPY